MPLANLRARLAVHVDPELNPAPGLSRFNRIIVLAILAVVIVGVLETEVRFIERMGNWLPVLEILFFLFFATEYLLRLAVARFNPRYGTAWRYALTPAALLDLAVLISFLTPLLGLEAAVFRLLRLARLVRLARMGRYSQAMRLLYAAMVSRGPELVISISIALALMLATATLLWLVEAPGQPEAFGSIPRALWWAVATLTTVGYGDIVPITALGRLFAAATALCGIGIIALPTGVLAGAFSDAIRQAREAAQASAERDER